MQEFSKDTCNSDLPRAVQLVVHVDWKNVSDSLKGNMFIAPLGVGQSRVLYAIN